MQKLKSRAWPAWGNAARQSVLHSARAVIEINGNREDVPSANDYLSPVDYKSQYIKA